MTPQSPDGTDRRPPLFPPDLSVTVETGDLPEAAIERLRAELARRGYGVLASLPVHEILREKLGEVIEPTFLLDVCAPRHASRALAASRSVALLLPCKIVVTRHGSSTLLALLRPTTALGRLLPDAGLGELGREVEAELTDAVTAAAGAGATEPRPLPPEPVTAPEGAGAAAGPHHHGADRAWTREEGVALLEGGAGAAALDADRFWDRVGLHAGEVVVDVGAGAGRFAVPAARRVGPGGIVEAVDLSEELVGFLAETARRLALPQLRAVRSAPDRIPLPDASADVVLLANVLHDISPATVREAVRVLRPGGRLVDLDWKKEPSPMGPPPPVRLTPDQASARLAAEDLAETARWDAGPYHYAVMFVKPAG